MKADLWGDTIEQAMAQAAGAMPKRRRFTAEDVRAAERAAAEARDLEWSKAAGLMSADYGKATTPEQYAELVKDAKQIFKRQGAEAMRERCAAVVERECAVRKKMAPTATTTDDAFCEKTARFVRALPLEPEDSP